MRPNVGMNSKELWHIPLFIGELLVLGLLILSVELFALSIYAFFALILVNYVLTVSFCYFILWKKSAVSLRRFLSHAKDSISIHIAIFAFFGTAIVLFIVFPDIVLLPTVFLGVICLYYLFICFFTWKDCVLGERVYLLLSLLFASAMLGINILVSYVL